MSRQKECSHNYTPTQSQLPRLLLLPAIWRKALPEHFLNSTLLIRDLAFKDKVKRDPVALALFNRVFFLLCVFKTQI